MSSRSSSGSNKPHHPSKATQHTPLDPREFSNPFPPNGTPQEPPHDATPFLNPFTPTKESSTTPAPPPSPRLHFLNTLWGKYAWGILIISLLRLSIDTSYDFYYPNRILLWLIVTHSIGWPDTNAAYLGKGAFVFAAWFLWRHSIGRIFPGEIFIFGEEFLRSEMRFGVLCAIVGLRVWGEG